MELHRHTQGDWSRAGIQVFFLLNRCCEFPSPAYDSGNFRARIPMFRSRQVVQTAGYKKYIQFVSMVVSWSFEGGFPPYYRLVLVISWKNACRWGTE